MISSGLFVLVAIAYAKTGPSLILSYALASILVLPTIFSKCELVTALPRTGGIFVFTDRSMGPLAGTLAGLAAWFSLAFKTAFALLGMGIFITLVNPDISQLQIKLIAIACCLLFTVINLLGVKLTGQFQSYVVIILLACIAIYIVAGAFFIDYSRFTPFLPFGVGAMVSTAGFVFIAFAGTTKIASVAGEVKNPSRNLPLGIILSWLSVSIVYLIVIFITVGVVNASILQNTLLPISIGGEVIMGKFGLILMNIAGLLAFITTGNSGILATSRTPMAMGKAAILPISFSKLSKRGTPWVAILATSFFMIVIMLCLDLELFIKTASTLKLILFAIANISVICLRKSRSRFYKPTFKSPFYPWIQIIGVIGYAFLIIDMGLTPLLITFAFTLCGLAWYFLYAQRRIKYEYRILKIIKKIAGIRSKGYMFDEEYREVFVGRDKASELKFENKMKECMILNITDQKLAKGVYKKIANDLANKLGVKEQELYKRILAKKQNPIILNGSDIIFLHVKGRNLFEMALVRVHEETALKDEFPAIPATIVIATSFDEEYFYLRVLKWIVQITRMFDFDKKWMKAKDVNDIRQIVLSAWRERV
jgi:basic amino acid/polyamine antiporter, APA family